MERKFTELVLSGNLLLLTATFSLTLISCNIINPAEPVPAYVHVGSIALSTTSAQGSNSNKIVDSWVYVDGNIVGIYEMPATLPVLSAGSHNLTIRPGILINGIAATRTAYPFYTGYDTTVNFESAKTISVSPKVTYTSSTRFLQNEDFDQAGLSLKKFSGSDTMLVVDTLTANRFEGNCGAVFLDAAHDFFMCSSIDSFPLPLGTPAYIELNYMGDNEFTAGLITYTASAAFATDIVTFKATGTWRKEYINLTPFITSASAFAYKIYLKATKSSTLTNASIYFDNIKVVN